MVAQSLVALLVEDDPGDAELIAARLRAAPRALAAPPVRLVRADSVATACAVLRQSTVDVVLLDLTLPDACGLEALSQVRAAAFGVPVVVLTGSADESIVLETVCEGTQEYVLKRPPDDATLRRIVRYARERQSLLRELDVALHASVTAALGFRLLTEAGHVLAAATEPRSAFGEVARMVVPDGADCFVAYLMGNGEVPPVLEVVHGDPVRSPELHSRMRGLLMGPDDSVDWGMGILQALEAASLRGIYETRQPLLDLLGMASGITVAINVGGQASGFIVLATSAGRSQAAANAEFGRALADRIGLALERALLSRHMQRALAVRDRALGIVSHDLRNPLSTIQICARALLDPEPPPDNGIHDMVLIIQRSAEWMQHIVQDLLDRSNIDTGRLSLEQRLMAVTDVIAAARVIFTPIAEDQSLEFIVDGEDDLPRVYADPHRVLQVLSNLLSNAMKFTPASGRIVLSARFEKEPAAGHGPMSRGGGVVRIAVSDTGRGIPPEDLPHVFDWFWQAAHCGKSGAGLGLAIAKGIIEAHRGHLHVDSVPGQGSTFWFTLPAAGTREPRIDNERERVESAVAGS